MSSSSDFMDFWTVVSHCELEIDKRIPACWGPELLPLSEYDLCLDLDRGSVV